MSNVKLSVCCITFNHEKYISETIESMLMQETDFEFEILIYDDASTDNTSKIIKKYESNFPDKIKAIYQNENQFSKGFNPDAVYNWPRIRGEYVALCEGDDYWIDKKKLQKQVDFLDNNLFCTICFHPVYVIDDSNKEKKEIFPTKGFRFNKDILELEDLLKYNFIQTNSIVYRWKLKNKENTFPKNILPFDHYLHLLHAKEGSIGFMPDVMAVYRKHIDGLWNKDNFYNKNGMLHISFFKLLEKEFNVDKTEEIQDMAEKTIKALLKVKDFNSLMKLEVKFPNLYQNVIDKIDFSDKKIKKKYNKYKILSIFLFIILLFLVVNINSRSFF